MLIDTHAHIYSKELSNIIDDVILNSQKMGVTKIIMPNIDETSIEIMCNVKEKFQNICEYMMGLHPCSVKDNYKSILSIIENELYNKNYIAVGEIGLDLYWDKTTLNIQIDALKTQLKWAYKLNLPVSIHCRNAYNELIKVLKEIKDIPKGIIHCFSGTLNDFQKLNDIGFYFGAGGVITYKNSGMDKIFKEIPLNKIVLETDAPYLTPTPHRGKLNTPEYLKIIAEKLAEIKEIDLMEIENKTTDNAIKIFNLNL